MADIFISYSKTRAAEAEELANELGDLAYDVWWDTSLLPAGAFGAEIDRQLDAADAVIVIWSPKSVRSKWVRSEAAHGDRQDKLINTHTSDLAPARQIPKPFDQIHSVRIDNIRAIVAALDALQVPRSGGKAMSVSDAQPSSVADADDRLFAEVERAGTAEAYGYYLDELPEGRHALIAKFRLKAVKNAEDQPTAQVSDAIETHKTDENDYNDRGKNHYVKGEYDLAIADFSRAIEIDPTDADDYNNRGLAYADKGDDDGAIADFSRAIEIDPKYAYPYSNRGNAHRRKGDYDLAIADFNKSIEIGPTDAGDHNSRGAAYWRKGDHDRALADFNKAIEINPKHASAYNHRAWTYFDAGKAAQGLPDAERSLQLRPNDPATLDTRGHIFEALGRREEAIADFRRALSFDPNQQGSSEALKRLGAAP